MSLALVIGLSVIGLGVIGLGVIGLGVIGLGVIGLGVIGLGRRAWLASVALVGGFWVSRFVLGPAICLAIFALAAISAGLFSAFLFTVFRGPVVQVGLGDAPPPSRLLTFAAAVAIASLE